MVDPQVIAIDGPVAAGKTIVGRELARRLGFRYLDTGIMYRALTWLALSRGVPMADEDALGELAHRASIRPQSQGGEQVWLGEVELGVKELRDPQVDRHVAMVSRAPEVRRAMVRQQRELAAEGRMVMVGRDIGTVVLPSAEIKVFMSASVQERARRRWRDLLSQGHTAPFVQILRETEDRDHIDTHRDDSPLLPAEDAYQIDTEGLTINEVVDLILDQTRRGSEKAD